MDEDRAGRGFNFGMPGTTQDCMLCPFGLAAFALRGTKPEAMEHLMKAGQELLLALKVFVESAAEKLDRSEPLQRVPIH